MTDNTGSAENALKTTRKKKTKSYRRSVLPRIKNYCMYAVHMLGHCRVHALLTDIFQLHFQPQPYSTCNSGFKLIKAKYSGNQNPMHWLWKQQLQQNNNFLSLDKIAEQWTPTVAWPEQLM